MERKGQWFVVQALSGHEMKVKKTIKIKSQLERLEDYIFEILVPVEAVTEVKLGKKTTTNRKFFPGYILVNTSLYDSEGTLNEEVWTFINGIDSVIGFIGGGHPVPLSKSEMDDIFHQLDKGKEGAQPKIDFDLGEMVKICDGAFENFEGKIESIDPERGKLKLSVAIFGRHTPVEVEYWQVERM